MPGIPPKSSPKGKPPPPPKNIDDFNNYKDAKLDGNVTYIKYSLLLDGAIQYTMPKTEYSKNRVVSNNKVKPKNTDNTSQKNSRNN